MANLFNMEFARFLKSKSTYIILIVAAVASLLYPCVFKLMDTVSEALDEASEVEEIDDEIADEMKTCIHLKFDTDADSVSEILDSLDVDYNKINNNSFDIYLAEDNSSDILKSLAENNVDIVNVNVEDISTDDETEDAENPLSATADIMTSVYGERNILNTVVMNIMGYTPLLLIALFTVIFINGELKNGFVKNLVGYSFNRSKFVCCNLIIVSIMAVLILLVTVVTTIGATLVLFPDYEWGNSSDFALYLSTETLVHVSFALFMSSLAYLTRTTALPMVIGIVLSQGLGTLLYSLITVAAKKLIDTLPDDFQISDYTLTGNVGLLNLDSVNDDFIRAIVIGCIGLVLFAFGSCYFTQSKDIK